MLYEPERLIVREWEESDNKDMFEYAGDPVITKFLHFAPHSSPEISLERIKFVRSKYTEHSILGDYCIDLKEINKAIGSTGKRGQIITIRDMR